MFCGKTFAKSTGGVLTRATQSFHTKQQCAYSRFFCGWQFCMIETYISYRRAYIFQWQREIHVYYNNSTLEYASAYRYFLREYLETKFAIQNNIYTIIDGMLLNGRHIHFQNCSVHVALQSTVLPNIFQKNRLKNGQEKILRKKSCQILPDFLQYLL